MSSADVVGKVVSIHQYPVKSMIGEDLNASSVRPKGLGGDRLLVLILHKALSRPRTLSCAALRQGA